MTPELRDYFDRQLERVLPELPEQVHRLLEEVPLYVEDYPSADLLRRLGLRHRASLCGLYTGVPRIRRSVEMSGILSDVVYLYREGILSLARDAQNRIDERELRRQIRITILHELGHHHGLEEDELRDLGY